METGLGKVCRSRSYLVGLFFLIGLLRICKVQGKSFMTWNECCGMPHVIEHDKSKNHRPNSALRLAGHSFKHVGSQTYPAGHRTSHDFKLTTTSVFLH
jgi:hypothetical protein